MKHIVLAAIAVFSASVLMAQTDEDVKQLVEWMSGSFSSAKQAEKDESFRNVVLHMTPIWTDRDDELEWLYVEQALAEKEDQPYRQRVYRIKRVSDEVIASDVLMLPNPGEYVGAWQNPLMFKNLAPSDLTLKEGCTVFLEYDGFANYSGSTMDEQCKSSYRDAAYTTSEVTVMPSKIISWDRGFNEEGEQVWGSEKGGYEFEKISE